MSTTTHPTFEAMIAAGDEAVRATKALAEATDKAVETEDAYMSRTPRPVAQREAEYEAMMAARRNLGAAFLAVQQATPAAPEVGRTAIGADGLTYRWGGALTGWSPVWPDPSV